MNFLLKQLYSFNCYFSFTLLYPVRTRVPQMASSVSQRRTGNMLPPPGDDFSYSAVVSAKHTFKNATLVCSLR
jgi:hypothetical protein